MNKQRLTSEIKTGQYIEWCTALPALNKSVESSIFYLKGYNWFLRIFYKDCVPPYYEFHMDMKNKYEYAYVVPCSVRYEVGFKHEEDLSLGKEESVLRKENFFWGIYWHELQPVSEKRKWIKVRIFVDDPLEENRDHTGDKEVQTSLYTDPKFLLEGISNDLFTLFDEGPGHDVEFVCEDVILKAHKNIVCCRSDVFTSMFRSDMEEGKTGRVKIVDIEISVFREFLKYLYTGMLPELTVPTAKQFYEVADKYAVHSLKKLCASFLIENLTSFNVCEILIMSDRHTDLDFKKDVMQYIMERRIPKLIREKWTNFCKDNPTLSNEVLNFLYQNSC